MCGGTVRHEKWVSKMKKFFSLLMVVLVFLLLSGCSERHELVGTWEYENNSTRSFTFNRNGTGLEIGASGRELPFYWTVEENQFNQYHSRENMAVGHSFDVWSYRVEDDNLILIWLGLTRERAEIYSCKVIIKVYTQSRENLITLQKDGFDMSGHTEKRLSNFLLWQCAYSEFWFTDILWPDFSAKVLEEAILDYSKRKRRYGGI